MLFRRQVLLQFGPPGAAAARSFGDLRLSFRVELARAGRPCTAKIEVYNLSNTSIDILRAPDSRVQLLAGYDVPQMIFEGNPTRNGVVSRRRGVDTVVTIEAQSGGRALSTTHVRVSFATEVTLSQVYAAIVPQLGLGSGVVRLPTGAADIRFPHGLTIDAPARDVLTRLAAASSSDWFIHDGALNFLPRGEDTGQTAIVFSSANGNLIGSPAPKTGPAPAAAGSTATPKWGAGAIEFTGLLDPAVRPGRLVQVESPDLKGLYIARDVVFEGDSGWENKFYVTVTAEPRA